MAEPTTKSPSAPRPPTPRPSSPAPEAAKPLADRTVGELVLDVSERTSLLVREEIELAKAEVTEKATQLIKGSVVGAAAGVFVLLALAMLMHAFAWMINDLIDGAIWVGFLIEAIIFLLIAAAAGLFAYRAVQSNAKLTPSMAIEEAKLTRETFEAPS